MTGNRSLRYTVASVLLVNWLAMPRSVSAQEFFLDPEESINDYLTIGDFNVDGDIAGWTTNGSVTASVLNGVLEATTTGGDPFFFRAGIAGTTPAMTKVEARIRVFVGDGGGWELFWGEEAAPGFAGGRRIGYSAAADGEFHIYQWDLSAVLTSRIHDVRIDPGPGAGTRLEVDWVRVGTNSPDTDEDGLPDSVETDTGVFNGPRDTGTNPDDPDSDGDGFDDGEEVALGTDPNDVDDVPQAELASYETATAVYVIDTEIPPNNPVVNSGTPESFEVAPALPDGLDLDATTGVISGTPSEVSAAADYEVTATFGGGLSDSTTINIEVRNPFIRYPFADVRLEVGQVIAGVLPEIVGPAPTSFEIEPDLPAELFLDTDTGELFGTAFESSPRTEYTVFALYDDFPDFELSMFVEIVGLPVLTVDPVDTINDFVSVAEFNTGGDLQGWAANACTLVASNGLLDVTTTGGDPYFFRTAIAATMPELTIVESRYRVVQSDGVNWELFWGEEAAPGFSGLRRFPHTPIEDGEFHVYHYDLSQVVSTRLTDVRWDPGGGPGTVVEVDYVRIGTVGADTDEDGLPDSVETNTGVFNGPRDTGTDPENPDSDDDGFDDGEEVTFGTDPNNPDDAPVPTLLGYTVTSAIYLPDVEIEPNDPITEFATPTSFAIDPTLPDGLDLDADTGRISGTPTTEDPPTDYLVTATFPSGETDMTTISIQVSNPFFTYPNVENVFTVERQIQPLAPLTALAEPLSYEIEPDLPLDLVFDEFTGIISGRSLDPVERTEYTVYAVYEEYPEAETTIFISVFGAPEITVDPDDPLPPDILRLGEFDDEADLASFASNSMELTVDTEAGILNAATTGPDPYIFNLGKAVTAECAIIEARIRLLPGGAAGWQIFWAEDAPGRNGAAEERSFRITAEGDDEFHVYRFDLRDAVVGPLILFRLDPGDDAGTTLEIDYIRFGDCTGIIDDGPLFIRGDSDGNGGLELTDAVFLLNFLFLGGPPPLCAAAANSNGEGAPGLTSAIYVLNFLFLGGPQPPAPYPDCGPGTEIDDAVGCLNPPESCL